MDGLVPIGDLRLTRHMERHHPTRVLRQAEALRKILTLHKSCPSADGPEGVIVCATCGPHGEDGNAWMFVEEAQADPNWHYPCDTIKTLAEGYGIEP